MKEPSRNTGKIITKIKINKKNAVLYFNHSNKDKLELSKDTLTFVYLYEGKQLSYKDINELKDISSCTLLFNKALSILRHGHYSEWRMREKLYASDDNKKNVDFVIKRLKNADLINDEMLMLDYVEYANEKCWGKNKIIIHLQEKGIFDKEIKKLKFSSSKEKEKALSQLPKLEKKYDKYSYEEKKRHIYHGLLSLGFDQDISLLVIDKIKPINQKIENDKLKNDLNKIMIRYKKKYDGYILKDKVIKALRNKGYKYNDINREWEKAYGEIDF